MHTYYRLLAEPWDILPPISGPVKEYYNVKDANQEKFAGDRLMYPVWRHQFLATVHGKRMNISDKALALSVALQKNAKYWRSWYESYVRSDYCRTGESIWGS
jgi:hypothetical protein